MGTYGWSNGDELLVFDFRNQTLAVQVTTVGDTRPGSTSRIFQVPAGAFIAGVMPGGLRFLTNTIKDATALSGLEIVPCWPSLPGER